MCASVRSPELSRFVSHRQLLTSPPPPPPQRCIAFCAESTARSTADRGTRFNVPTLPKKWDERDAGRGSAKKQLAAPLPPRSGLGGVCAGVWMDCRTVQPARLVAMDGSNCAARRPTAAMPSTTTSRTPDDRKLCASACCGALAPSARPPNRPAEIPLGADGRAPAAPLLAALLLPKH